jgi:hypothetical protein
VKNCLVCSAPVHPSAPHCPQCGEASFSATADAPPSPEPPVDVDAADWGATESVPPTEPTDDAMVEDSTMGAAPQAPKRARKR